MKQGTIFTNAALAAVLATSMATAPALSGLAHSQGATLAGVAYAAQAAQATPIESVVITRDWTATDEENQVIIDKAEAAELVGLKPLKDYLSGETVAAADFLTIDVDALATHRRRPGEAESSRRRRPSWSRTQASAPEAKPETKPEPAAPAQPAETPAASARSSTPSASASKGAAAEQARRGRRGRPRGHGAGKRHP